MNYERYIQRQRLRRRQHVRKRVRGVADRPRLCVVRTLKNMYCQVFDDEQGKTLVSATTRDKDIREEIKNGGNAEAAKKLGEKLAEKALAAGIRRVSFDRGHCKYHGRLAALADAAREKGLEF